MSKVLAVLPDNIINKIAAGEVIERPASIVRELVDNAIDAHATSISVEISEGGQNSIRVTDNGIGMSESDARLCFARHATSKIKSMEDLESIASLGFRGEALSSIAAVAQVTLCSKQVDSEVGTKISLRDGKVVSQNACAAAVGSEFEVTRLFSTLPARRKFLKTPRTDFTKVQDWLYQSALANPTVRYRFVADGKEIFRLSEHKDIFARLDTLIHGTTIRVDYKAGPIAIKGLVAHPSQADYKVGGFVFILNGRPIQDRILMRALRDAWSTGLRPGENPVGALEINLPCSEVDVNVHPQKSEVRFRNSQAVFGSLYNAIKAGLSEWKPNFTPTSATSNWTVQETPVVTGWQESTQLAFAEPSVSGEFISERYIGQVLGVFLLFERAEKTFLVDAHAAHERIRFNELLDWARKKSTLSQRLLIPERVSLLPSEVASLLEKQEFLAEFGLHFTAEEQAISISELPLSLRIAELNSFLVSLAAADTNAVRTDLQRIIEKTLARTACRSSVMSGHKLSDIEAQSLWQKIKTEPHGAVCPHGRPVMVELSRQEIDQLFFRDGF